MGKQYPNHDEAVSQAVKKSRKPRLSPYPDEAIVLALSVIQGGGSYRDAARAVQGQMGKRPDHSTVRKWMLHSAEAFAKLQPEKKREWEDLAGQVFEAWSKRALEAAEARKEDGSYAVSHQQCMIGFGIAKDGLRSVLEAVQSKSGPMVAVQFNLRTSED